MESINNNFPTKEELIAWKGGQFPSGPRKEELQKLFAEDPFLKDALEGMQYDDTLSGLPINPPKGVIKSSFKSHFLGWGIGVIAGLLLGGACYLFVKNDSTSAADNRIDLIVKNIPPAQLKKDSITQVISPHSSTEKAKPKLISEPNQITAQANSEEIPLISNKENGRLSIPTRSQAISFELPTIELALHKVYPYYERNNAPDQSSVDHQHVSAAYSNNTEQSENADQFKKQSYLSYLERGLVELNTNNWIGGEEVFNIILQQYPDDINALYYKGFCAFQMGNKKQAAFLFEKVNQHPVGVFKKESAEFLRICQ
jgi:hypothetical protein